MKSREKILIKKTCKWKKKENSNKKNRDDRKNPMRMKFEKNNNSKQNKSQLKELEPNLKY